MLPAGARMLYLASRSQRRICNFIFIFFDFWRSVIHRIMRENNAASRRGFLLLLFLSGVSCGFEMGKVTYICEDIVWRECGGLSSIHNVLSVW